MSTGPNFGSKQFLDQNVLNNAFAAVNESIGTATYSLCTAGVLWPALASLSMNSTAMDATFTWPFTIVFPSGLTSQAHGTVSGQDTQSYTTDCSSLTPGSGSITVYWYATYVQIQQTPTTIVGPPVGHPSYNPNFVPYTLLTLNVDSFAINAGTSVPAGSIELARATLSSAGTVSGFTTSFQPLSAAPIGHPAGTYPVDHVVVDGNGRISSFGTTSHGVVADSNPGSRSFVVPANVYQVKVRCLGGGGGGGGSGAGGAGAGGGGGGYAEMWIGVTPGQSIPYIVGTGGLPGTAGGGGGGDGGATYCNGMTCNGGGGGTGNGSGSFNGYGGTSSGGSFNVYGSPGGVLMQFYGGYYGGGVGGGAYQMPGPPQPNISTAGNNGPGNGTGGNGAGCDLGKTQNNAGGAGAPGLVIFEW